MEETQNLNCDKDELAYTAEVKQVITNLKDFFKWPNNGVLFANGLRMLQWYKEQLENNTQILTRDAKGKVSVNTFKF